MKYVGTLVGAFSLSIMTLYGQAARSSQTLAATPWQVELDTMQGFPTDDAHFQQGVSACMAAAFGSQLLLAGGCNFPEMPAAEGGKKQYYQTVYCTSTADSVWQWHPVGQLPQPTAYGWSLPTSDGMICIGGMNEKGALRQVYQLICDSLQHTLQFRALPSLPFTLDNMSGTRIEDCLYVVGGNRQGIPSHTLLKLDLRHCAQGWQKLPDFPGEPRIQPVCAGQAVGQDHLIYMWGGFATSVNGTAPSLSTDGYCYSTRTGKWTSLPAPIDAQGETISLGGGVATLVQDSLILCTGGVHRDIFLEALRAPQPGYLSHPAAWYRLNGKLLLYHTRTRRWQQVGEYADLARAGAVLTSHENTFYYINGELKPGIRTPSIIRLQGK